MTMMLLLRRLLVALFVASFIRSAESRNPKKGISMHTSQSCRALEEHSDTSWWYSWGATSDGFSGGGKGSFCDQPVTAASNARAAGMDFVPMFWNSVPTTLSAETEANLIAAQYLMTFNEPEQAAQANLSPQAAAQLWPDVVSIATSYSLDLVAPCTTSDGNARKWYNEWLGNCTSMYGQECAFDFTCIHMYYHPYPCDGNVFD